MYSSNLANFYTVSYVGHLGTYYTVVGVINWGNVLKRNKSSVLDFGSKNTTIEIEDSREVAKGSTHGKDVAF